MVSFEVVTSGQSGRELERPDAVNMMKFDNGVVAASDSASMLAGCDGENALKEDGGKAGLC